MVAIFSPWNESENQAPQSSVVMLVALCSLSKPVPSEQRSTLLSCHITIVPSPQATASISTHWQPSSAAFFNADKEFYSFHRSIEAYKNSIGTNNDVLILDGKGDFFKYLKNQEPNK